MVFGQSVFQSLLTRLENEDPLTAETARSQTIRGLSAGFVMETLAQRELSEPLSAYLDFIRDISRSEDLQDITVASGSAPVTMSVTQEDADDRPVQPTIATPPDWIARNSDAEIASDLGLTGRETLAELAERRRRFALTCHPDRVEPAWREAANRRMMTVNRLIDDAQALKNRR